MSEDEKGIFGAGRELEGDAQSSGLPEGESAPTASGRPPLGGLKHWRESTITKPGLDERGTVFFAAVEMTRMPMILTDPNQPDNPIVFANKAFLDLTGYEESEILGRNCRFLQGPGTDREAVAEMREAVAARESVSVEVMNYKRDGTPFWNAVFIGPVYDKEGSLLYFFASQLDVSRRKSSEQASRQAQKMEAVGQLTAGLAHDFNNLLQVVSGNLEMLKSRGVEQPGDRFVDNAYEAAQRGAKLTRQLLAFARKTRLEPRAVDLSDTISAFAPMMESALGPTIELHLSLRRRLPSVTIDPDQFEMSLFNVLLNARDAVRGGGLVVVSTRTVHLNGDAPAHGLPSGDYVAVEVRDDGEGMPPHVIARATEPFFTTKSVGKGTGLGLAMASGFALQSRGRLEIESEVGKGTLIRFLFPISKVTATTEADRPHPAAGVRPAWAGGERILVVDDQPEILELAAEILGQEGYRVSTASGGEEALEMVRREPFDLLFTDIVMPGAMGGFELLEAVREAAPSMPVLMTTGYNEDLAGEGPKRTGLDVIGKPYRRAELVDRVRQALDAKAGGAERRRPSDFGAAEA